MKKKSFDANIYITIDWAFYLIPTICLDWHAEQGYGVSEIKWLWFTIGAHHHSTH